MSPYDRVKSYILNDYLESESFKEEILVAAEKYGVNRIDVVKSAYVGKCLCNKIDYISNGIGGNVDKNDLAIILKAIANDQDVSNRMCTVIEDVYKTNDIPEKEKEYISDTYKLKLSVYDGEYRIEHFYKVAGTYVMDRCIFSGGKEECTSKFNSMIGG